MRKCFAWFVSARYVCVYCNSEFCLYRRTEFGVEAYIQNGYRSKQAFIFCRQQAKLQRLKSKGMCCPDHRVAFELLSINIPLGTSIATTVTFASLM